MFLKNWRSLKLETYILSGVTHVNVFSVFYSTGLGSLWLRTRAMTVPREAHVVPRLGSARTSCASRDRSGGSGVVAVAVAVVVVAVVVVAQLAVMVVVLVVFMVAVAALAVVVVAW